MKTESAHINVAIVEDDMRLRETLALILDRSPDCCCTGQYASGEEAVESLSPQSAPRVIIMDVNLPGINGVECVRRLVSKGVKSDILMLTVHKDTDVIFDALAAGAAGYLVKPVQPSQLLAAVRDIYGGGAPMSSSIARKVVQAFRIKTATAATEVLSKRELEVLELLVKGYLYKEIADQLSITYSTVHTHIERVYKKLHVNSRAQAVAKHLDGKRTVPY